MSTHKSQFTMLFHKTKCKILPFPFLIVIWILIIKGRSKELQVWNKVNFKTYTTNPWEEDGTETATFIPFPAVCSLNMTIFRWISVSDFGAFIVAAPKYVTPLNIVQSWSTSDTEIMKIVFLKNLFSKPIFYTRISSLRTATYTPSPIRLTNIEGY